MAVATVCHVAPLPLIKVPTMTPAVALAAAALAAAIVVGLAVDVALAAETAAATLAEVVDAAAAVEPLTTCPVKSVLAPLDPFMPGQTPPTSFLLDSACPIALTGCSSANSVPSPLELVQAISLMTASTTVRTS